MSRTRPLMSSGEWCLAGAGSTAGKLGRGSKGNTVEWQTQLVMSDGNCERDIVRSDCRVVLKFNFAAMPRQSGFAGVMVQQSD